ncbi:MAG: hypothetical protein LBH51_09060, partial [Treponema sp.]|nr:hypothetical protein [Treponema sp.]
MAEKRRVKDWLVFFLGSYRPPEFLRILFRFFFKGGIGRAVKQLGSRLTAWRRTRRVLFYLTLGLILLGAGGLFAWRFYQSRKPQPIHIEYTLAQAPRNGIGSATEALPLRLEFYGSAAPLELIGQDLAPDAANLPVSISPPVAGQWRWERDDTLTFTASGSWEIGREYTVTLGRGLLAPQVLPSRRSLSFTIPDFSLEMAEGEFYIDPEDATIKRVTVVLNANYPIDTASLEAAVAIAPRGLKANSGRLENRPYGFTLSYNQDRTTAYIVSEPIGTPAQEVMMEISLKRGVKAANGEGSPSPAQSSVVGIPGMTGYVQVRNLAQELVKNDDQKFDQVLILSTRGTIQE